MDETQLRTRLLREMPTGSPPADLEGIVRRARILRARRATKALAAGAIAVAAIALPLAQLSGLGGGRRPADEGALVLSFEARPGWHVAAFPAGPYASPSAWAANVPFAPEDLGQGSLGYPAGTAESLPPDGVVIVASVELETRNQLPAVDGYPVGPLVLDAPRSGYEGQRPGTSLTVASATVDGRLVNVTALFGSEEPTPELLAEANGQLEELVVVPAPPPVRNLDDFGIRMEIPDDWHGWLFRRGGEPQLHAGTLATTDLYDGTSVRPDMGPDDVFVVLSESIAAQDRWEPVQLPISLRAEDECPTCEILDDGRGPPPGHTLFSRTFSVGNRRFSLYAEFGAQDVPGERLQALNEILMTLRIDSAGSLPPSDPGVEPSVLPPGPSFTATEETPFHYLGVSVEVPTGWSAVAAPLSEPAVAPVVAMFGSATLPRGGDCAPEPALSTLASNGALVWIAEHPAPADRGDHYIFTRYAHDPTAQPMRWACGASAPSRMELWRLEGRFLEVHVALGWNAGPERVAEVESLLNSLHVQTAEGDA
jgi:hypothetical protein